jgi:hypothetical protein
VTLAERFRLAGQRDGDLRAGRAGDKQLRAARRRGDQRAVNVAIAYRSAGRGSILVEMHVKGPRSAGQCWDDPERGAALVALYRRAGRDPDANRLVRELIEREVVAVITEHLGGADASARAGVAASQIAGLIFMRYVLRSEPLSSMPLDELGRPCRLGTADSTVCRACTAPKSDPRGRPDVPAQRRAAPSRNLST